MMNAIKSIFHKIFGGITAGTVVRTMFFFLALVNQILSATGRSPLPITNEQKVLLPLALRSSLA